MTWDKKIKQSRWGLGVCGAVLLLLGITCSLVWWPAIVTVFQGLFGPLAAVAGMVLLSMINEEKDE